jgi:glyoxylase-like metal-dependent hydrolase (beta-lactamase superfamily II)
MDEAQFAVPADTRAAYAAMPPRPFGLAAVQLDDTKAVAVTDWIVQIPGGFNVVLVHQPNGVVVIEATTSGQYSQAVIAAAAKRFPGAKIKAVVTTSDAWPHVGGIREYVAQGVPIYPLDLNVSFLTRLANAAHTFTPDTLARQPKAPIFKPVSERTVIGSGDTRIELLPVRGETGERAMIAWLPGAHVLYSSDLIQRSSRAGTGFFMPEMLAEVATAVEREHLDGVERVIGMHLGPTPWEDITRAIAAAKGGD